MAKRISKKLDTDVEPVLCDEHHAAMKFVPSQGYWACEFPGCTRKKYPVAEVEEAGIPIVGQGPLELMIYKDKDSPTGRTIILRSKVNNVIMDVTPYFIRAGRDRGSGRMDITLEMDKIVDADGITKRDFFGG